MAVRRVLGAVWNEYGWVVIGCIAAGLITSTVAYSRTHSFTAAAAVGDLTDAVCFWGWAARDALKDARANLPGLHLRPIRTQAAWTFWTMVRVNLLAEAADMVVRPVGIGYLLSQAGDSLVGRSAHYVLAIFLADVVFFSIRAASKRPSARLSARLEACVTTWQLRASRKQPLSGLAER